MTKVTESGRTSFRAWMRSRPAAGFVRASMRHMWPRNAFRTAGNRRTMRGAVARGNGLVSLLEIMLEEGR